MATHRLSSKGHTAMFGLLPLVAVLAALALPPLPTLVFALALVVWGVTGLTAPKSSADQTPSPDAGAKQGAMPPASEDAAAVATAAAATPTAAAVRPQPATRPHNPAMPAEHACVDAESSSEAGVSEEATSVLTPSPSELADRRFEGWHPLVAAGAGGHGFLSLGASTAGSEEGTDGESETDGEGWQDQFEELVQVRYVQLPRLSSTQACGGYQAPALWPQPFQPMSLATFPHHPQPLQPLY